MKLNKKPRGTLETYNVANGGVEGLAFISQDQVNKKNGVLASSFENRIPAQFMNTSALNHRPMLKGRDFVLVNEPERWTLTNYNLSQDYAPHSAYGVISINHDEITFTSNVTGVVSFVLAGREFQFESLKRYIEAPWLLNSITPIQVPQVTFESSPFVTHHTEDSHLSTDWELSLVEDFSTVVEKLENSSTQKYQWAVSNLLPRSYYYVRVRYHGVATADPSDWSNTFVLTTSMTAKVNQPVMVSPSHLSNDNSLDPVLTATSFQAFEWVDTHKATDWMISSDASFSDPEYFIHEDEVIKNTWTPGRLKVNTTYFTKLRYKGNALGWSEWSNVVSFKTINLVAAKPTITYPSLNDQDLPYAFTVTTTNFNSVGNLTHVSSDWEIATDVSFSTVIRSLYASATSKLSWDVQGLPVDTTLYIRARHNASNGIVSQWSNVIVAKTAAAMVVKPMILTPPTGTVNTDLLISLVSTAYAGNGTETHTSSKWQLSLSSTFSTLVEEHVSSTDLTTWTTPQLLPDTQYYVRIQHTNSGGTVSPWSNACALKTKPVQVYMPTVVFPGANSTVDFHLEAKSSLYNQVGDIDHVSSSWQLASDASFATILLEDLTSTTNKLSWNVKLNPSTSYYIRVKHEGSLGFDSPWSAGVAFNTTALQIYAPQVLEPMPGESEVSLTPTITSSTFGANDVVNHDSSDWEVWTNGEDLVLVFSKTSTTELTSITLPTDLPHSSPLSVRVRYRSGPTVSPWSEPTNFTTEVWKIFTPVVLTAEDDPTDLSPKFTTAPFDPKGSITHLSSSWQISEVPDFATLVDSVTSSTTSLTTWTTSDLLRDKTYYLRVKFIGSGGIESSWGGYTYVTGQVAVAAPVITTPSNGASNQELLLSLTSSAFTSNDPSPHASTDWQVSKDGGFTDLVFSKMNSTDLLSTVTTELPYNSSVYARVRYRNALGTESAWSYVSRFFTKTFLIDKSAITSPANGSTIATYSPTIVNTAMTATGTVTYLRTDWQASFTEDFAMIALETSGQSPTQWALTGLDPNKTYYVRARHVAIPENSTVPLVADWSPVIHFTTPPLQVTKPDILYPLTNAVNVSQTPEILSSVFNANSGTHVLTEWQFASDVNFTSIIYSIPVAPPNPLTSLTIPYGSVTSLGINTVYYLRVRYRSDANVYSPWSSTVKFTTTTTVLAAPVLGEADFNASPSGQPQVTLTSSAMVVSDGEATTHSGSDWQVAKDNGFTDKVLDDVNNTTDKTSINLSIDP